MPLITLEVRVNVVGAKDDARCVKQELAREIAKRAVTEALEYCEGEGFRGVSDDYCVSVDSVEIA